jgi:hypothetical protein
MSGFNLEISYPVLALADIKLAKEGAYNLAKSGARAVENVMSRG